MNATAYTIVKYIIYDTISCVACVDVCTSMYVLSRNDNSSLEFSMFCLQIKPRYDSILKL